MRFLKLLLFLLPIGMVAQTTNQCPLSSSFSSTGAGTSLDNRLKGCYNWRFTYTSTGFSALSIQVEGSPDNSTWTALTVVTGDGANPSTIITFATSGFHINPSFIRVNLTAATGTGLVNWQLTGTAGAAPTSVFGSGGGGGGGGGVVVQPWTAGAGGVTAGQLLCVSRGTVSPATAITCPTAGVITNAQIDATIIGIAQGTVSAGGTVQVIVQGPATCTFDGINAVVAGHTANYSLSGNGLCQDSGTESTDFGVPFVGVATTSGTGLQSIYVMGSGLFGSRNHPIAPLLTTNPGGLFPENFQLQIAHTTQTMQTGSGFASGTSLPLASGLFVVGNCVMVDAGGSNSLVDAGAPCGTGAGTVTGVTGTSPIASSGGTAPAISCPTCVTGVSATAPVNSTGGTSPVISVTKVGAGSSLVAAASLGAAGNCANWNANGVGDAGSPCGSGSGGGGGVVTYSGPTLSILSGTAFCPIGGGGACSATETNVDIDSSATATVSKMFVQLSSALGAGNSVAVTWRANATSQPVTCTISGAVAASCNDTTHSFTATTADLLDYQLVFTGTILVTPTITIMSAFGTSNVGVTSVTATAPLNSSGGTAPVISATYQGNGAKVQASTGTTTTNDCVKFDANGNTVDAGAACATGSGGTTWNAPQSIGTAITCAASIFFQPFSDSQYFPYAYCNGSSVLSYYLGGQVVSPIGVVAGTGGAYAWTNQCAGCTIATQVNGVWTFDFPNHGATTNSLSVFDTAIPAAPSSQVFRIVPSVPQVGNNGNVGLSLRESATGKIISISIQPNADTADCQGGIGQGGPCIWIGLWTNTTTFSSTPASSSLGTAPSLPLTITVAVASGLTGNITVSYSPDGGATTKQVYQAAKNTFFTTAPDKIGFYGNVNHTNAPDFYLTVLSIN